MKTIRNKVDTMSSCKIVSLWILTLWILLAKTSANPVQNPSSTDFRPRHRSDPNPDLIPAGLNDRRHAATSDIIQGGVLHQESFDEEYDADAEYADDDDYLDFENDDAVVEPEMFQSLEGGTVPKRVVKMLKLISDDDEFLDGKGNTVRSYMPVKQRKCADLGEAYVFTMQATNSVEEPEELRYAELHFYAKHFAENDGRKPEEIPVSFYYAAESVCHPIGIQYVKIPKNGWLVTNVTSLLNHALIANKPEVTIAMYIVEGRSRHASPVHVQHEKLVKPYVFVYTDDMQKGDDAESNWQKLADRIATRGAESVIQESMSRRRRSVSVTIPDFNDTNYTLDNNEYPLVTVGKPTPDDTTHTAFTFFAEQNMRRIKSNRRRQRNQRKKLASKNMMLDAEDKSKSKKKKVNKPRPKYMDTDAGSNVCSLHPMFINFQEIGWDDYVIAPSTFEAGYCAGRCAFPIDKDLRPSNHALVQSLMHILGIQTGVPTPCCVPDKMESLSLLFADAKGNIVLKKYSDMIVESCRCQ